MDPKAIEKAAIRMGRMQQASANLAHPAEIPKLIDTWSDFIMAFSTFYSMLEQGAKVSNKSAGWFSSKLGERRKDPLLKYIKAARNSDEHGLQDILHLKSKSISLPPGGMMQLVANEKLEWEVKSVTGGPLQFAEPYLALVPVYDSLSKVWVPVPESHLGQPTVGISPYHASCLCFAYCEAMLVAAQALAP